MAYYIWITLLFTVIIELVTVALRMLWHLKSAEVQHKIHWPRTHHAYLGIAIILYCYFGSFPDYVNIMWLWVTAISLIASDLIHHLAMVPLLQKYKYDVHMVHHTYAHKHMSQWIAVLLIWLGVLALVTPFTPGSWLIPIGFSALVGKRKAGHSLNALLGRKFYNKLELNKFFKYD